MRVYRFSRPSMHIIHFEQCADAFMQKVRVEHVIPIDYSSVRNTTVRISLQPATWRSA